MAATVHTRDIPLILGPNRERLIGSWFSTGYYGHTRAKARIDLCNHYRQLARPPPPRKFIDREKSEARTHQFSRHDNRFKLEADPIIRATESGFGRRKSTVDGRGGFNPMFLSWLTPKTLEKNNDQSDSDDTSSKASFPSIVDSLPSFESSIYVKDYRHGQPTREQAKQIQQETFLRYKSTQTRRFLLRRNERSSNVASCLVWNQQKPEEKTLPKLPPMMETRNTFHSKSMIDFATKSQLEPNQSNGLVSKYM